nr:MAG TPA: hypothetical protein [Caudoviricetes sp.]
MKLPNKYHYCASADFNIGDNCCNKMKKSH